MPRNWEQVCQTWIKASSDTECDKQENAVRMIRKAVDEYDALAQREIKIIAQGSYRNNTNVRQESDVDIAVCCIEPFFADYQYANYTMQDVGNYVTGYTYAEFKNQVEAALVKKFGAGGVGRGDKAFDVHANTYRVDADVVATFAHRRYQPAQAGPLFGSLIRDWTKPEGTQFFADSGGNAIVNWPEQHYTNGVAKNKATNLRFKSVVRVLKNLKYDIEANGNAAQKQAAKQAPSYLCECLMYNVPDFAAGSPRFMVRTAIHYAWNQTRTDEACAKWVEVNGMKWLFTAAQPWTRAQANLFLGHAWEYGEF